MASGEAYSTMDTVVVGFFFIVLSGSEELIDDMRSFILISKFSTFRLLSSNFYFDFDLLLSCKLWFSWASSITTNFSCCFLVLFDLLLLSNLVISTYLPIDYFLTFRFEPTALYVFGSQFF